MAAFAQVYINYTAFAQYLLVLNDGSRRYLNSASLSKLAFHVYAAGVAIQIMLGQFFVVRLQLGMSGLGLTLVLTHAFIFAGLNLYPLLFREGRNFIQAPNWKATQNLGEYLEKGLPLAFMLCFEWMAFKWQVLMSGYLGIAEQATLTIFRTTTMVLLGAVIGI